jgi:membrane protease YdiL (CAAX protease family)
MTEPDPLPAPAFDAAPLPAGPPPNPFVRLKARSIILAWLALTLLASAAVIPATSESATLAVLGAIQYAALALVLLFFARRARLRWSRLFGPALAVDDLPRLWVVLPVAAISLGSFTLFWGPISYVFPEAVQEWAVEGMPELLTPGSPARMLAEGVIIVVLAPLLEELLFRGFLLHRWSHRWGLRTGVIMTSIAFAVVHVEPVGHFVFGLAMCALYLSTGSLWAPIAAHALNNGLVVLVMLPAALRGETPEEVTLDQIRSDWGEAIALVTVGIAIVIWFLRRHLRIRGTVPPYFARATEYGAPLVD